MPRSLQAILHEPNQLILFVGVGNVLHNDDGVGVYIANQIREDDRIRVIRAEVSIENYIGKINSQGASYVIIIDSVFLGKKPGFWKVMPVEELLETTTNTHNISLKQLSALFHSRVMILGIQPANVTFGEQISPEVIIAADEILKIINIRG